ncbi:complex I NDUFA9 subunit family protein [Gluconobacter morbifer]|nr:complex I NDUFA9 subunit family protein [Gluconobacter morbifer]
MQKVFSGNIGRTVAVLGGGGFIGRTLVSRLVARGHVVRVGGRHPERDQDLAHLPGEGRVEFVRASVTDRESLRQLFIGAEAAVNLVSIMSPDTRELHRINVDGAQCTAQMAQQAGVKHYVHMSAIGASRTSPASYGRSKGWAEKVVRDVFPTAGLLRPSVVFGPEDSFLNMFALMAKVSPVLPVFGARTHFQPVYVNDVADAAIRLLAEENAGRTVEAGGPEVLTMRELMTFILQVTGRHRLLLSVPMPVARLEARILEKLPGHLLTRDQVTLLGQDNVVQPGADTLQDLGIVPAALRKVAPGYLAGGIFESWRRFRA